MADRNGEVFGDYRLIRLLGKGGFAEVYLGEHIYLHTTAAIKLLLTRVSTEEEEEFREEASRVAHLEHHHIVPVLNYSIQQGVPFLVMQYAPHGSLHKLFPRNTPMNLATILPYIQQVAEALQYAHDQRVIHLDVKPENMLLGARGQVLLGDFGIALTLQYSQTHQTRSNFVGTVAYAAPEQLLAKPGLASDQYALATVVYRWLTGRLPFDKDQLILQKLQQNPTPLHVHVPELAPAVEQVVLRALARNPEDRFPSIQAFATALERANAPAFFPSPQQRALFASDAYNTYDKASAYRRAHISLFCLLSGVSFTVGVLTQSWLWAIGVLALLTLVAYLLGYRRVIAAGSVLLLTLFSGLIAGGLAWWTSTLNYAKILINPPIPFVDAFHAYTTSLPAQFYFGLIPGVLFALFYWLSGLLNEGGDETPGCCLGCLFFLWWPLIAIPGATYNWGFGLGFGWWFTLIGFVIGLVGGNGLATAIPIWLVGIAEGSWMRLKKKVDP